jgi:hypothetical protein
MSPCVEKLADLLVLLLPILCEPGTIQSGAGKHRGTRRLRSGDADFTADDAAPGHD